MGMPSYVPVADIESFLCTTNWTEMVMDLSAAYNMAPMMQQVGNNKPCSNFPIFRKTK